MGRIGGSAYLPLGASPRKGRAGLTTGGGDTVTSRGTHGLLEGGAKGHLQGAPAPAPALERAASLLGATEQSSRGSAPRVPLEGCWWGWQNLAKVPNASFTPTCSPPGCCVGHQPLPTKSCQGNVVPV